MISPGFHLTSPFCCFGFLQKLNIIPDQYHPTRAPFGLFHSFPHFLWTCPRLNKKYIQHPFSLFLFYAV